MAGLIRINKKWMKKGLIWSIKTWEIEQNSFITFQSTYWLNGRPCAGVADWLKYKGTDMSCLNKDGKEYRKTLIWHHLSRSKNSKIFEQSNASEALKKDDSIFQAKSH